MFARRSMRADTAARTGATLVEMVVALGVIVFLTGLTVTATTAVVQRAEVQETQNVITLLDTALQEWELSADRKLTWGDAEDEVDIWSDRAYVLVISELLDAIRRTPGPRDVLARIDADLVYPYREGETPAWITSDPYARMQLERFVDRKSITVLDAWGTPVYATHPGKLVAPGDPPEDIDGTENTPNEQIYGTARSRHVCFVSAGPDRRFGLYWEFPDLPRQHREEAIQAARRDNLYSYRPEWRD